MKLFDLQSSASDGIRAEIEALERKIQIEELRLKKQCKTQKTDFSRCSEERLNGASKFDWTQSYNTWDSWHDTEEIKNRILSAKERMKVLNAKKKSKCNKCSPLPLCASSQNRKAERQVVEMTMTERLRKMHEFREEGNVFYENKEYMKALALYEKSLIYYEYCFNGTADEMKYADKQRLTCLLNAAACFSKMLQYGKCIDYCTQALRMDTANSKALYRRAQAYRFLDKFDEAQGDINQAIAIGDNDKTGVFRKENLLLKRRMKQYNVETKKVAKRMWNRNAKSQCADSNRYLNERKVEQF